MGVVSQEAINQLQALMDEVDNPLKTTFQNVHQGFLTETLVRFLKAREWNPTKAHKMLVDSLSWRLQNEIDSILTKPIVPADLYRNVRDSQLIGLSGYSKEGLPVFAVGVGLSTFDRASVHSYVQSHIQINEYRDQVIFPSASKKYGRPITTCVKVLDMTGLKFSALSHIKLLTTISTIDDLNYPEKTNTYFIVNVPYIFSACWRNGRTVKSVRVVYSLVNQRQVVKPLLQERTRKKIQVLAGNGRDELLKIMDFESLPHFCKRGGSGSSDFGNESCYSLDHPFHLQLYNYMHQQSTIRDPIAPIKHGSFHVDFPELGEEGTEIAKTIEYELLRYENGNENRHEIN